MSMSTHTLTTNLGTLNRGRGGTRNVKPINTSDLQDGQNGGPEVDVESDKTKGKLRGTPSVQRGVRSRDRSLKVQDPPLTNNRYCILESVPATRPIYNNGLAPDRSMTMSMSSEDDAASSSLFSNGNKTDTSCQTSEPPTSPSRFSGIDYGPTVPNHVRPVSKPEYAEEPSNSASKEICRLFQKGLCRWGTNCHHQHVPSDLVMQRRPNPKVCRNFLAGVCRNGWCPRIHPKREENDPTVQPAVQQHAVPDTSSPSVFEFDEHDTYQASSPLGTHLGNNFQPVVKLHTSPMAPKTVKKTGRRRVQPPTRSVGNIVDSLPRLDLPRSANVDEGPIPPPSGLPSPVKPVVVRLPGHISPLAGPVDDKVDTPRNVDLPLYANVEKGSLPPPPRLPSPAKPRVIRSPGNALLPTEAVEMKVDALRRLDPRYANIEKGFLPPPPGLPSPVRSIAVGLPGNTSRLTGAVEDRADPPRGSDLPRYANVEKGSLPPPPGLPSPVKPLNIRYSGNISPVGVYVNGNTSLIAEQMTTFPHREDRRSGPCASKREICRDWQHGVCKRGQYCVYAHERVVPTFSPEHVVNHRPSGIMNSPVIVNRVDIGHLHSSNFATPHPAYENHVHRILGLGKGRDGATGHSREVLHPNTSGFINDIKPRSSLRPRRKSSETMNATVLTSTRVTLGAGFQVMDVTTGFESSMVTLHNLPSSVTEADVQNLAENYGEVRKVLFPGDDRRKTQKSLSVKVEFATPVQAADAVAGLHGASKFSTKIAARLALFNANSQTGRLDNSAVRVDFPAPGMTAYAGYATLGDAEKAISAVNDTLIRGSAISASLHSGLPKLGLFTVKFEGLPANTTEKELKSFGRVEDGMLGRANYNSLEGAVKIIRKLIEGCGEIVSFDIVSKAPKEGKIRAWVHFVTPSAAASACSNLRGRQLPCIGNDKLWLHHIHTVTYHVTSEIYTTLTSEILCLRRFAWTQSHTQIVIVQGSDPGARVMIKVSSENVRCLGEIKGTLERMLCGEKLTEGGELVWDKFFDTPAGFAFASRVAKTTSTHVRVDEKRGSITIFGSPAARQRARTLILDHLHSLQAKHTYSLTLSGSEILQLLLRDLPRLHDELGVDNVTLDISLRRLTVRGNEGTWRRAIDILAQGRNRANVRPAPRRDLPGCTICFDQVLSPVTLDCGHISCKACIVRYLTTAPNHKSFPLTCLGNDATCTELVPLDLAKELLSPFEVQHVVEAAFRTYVHARPKEFRYCPSADCPQIYRVTPGKKTLQCPSCLVRICPTCHEEEHNGVECKYSYDENERLFRQWRAANDVKACPGCTADIQKSAGCNHMTCSQCQTHICWVCMETFKGGEGIYEHMRAMHGGIGL